MRIYLDRRPGGTVRFFCSLLIMNKRTALFAPILLVLSGQVIFGDVESLAPLTEAEALAIVRSQREATAARELERKERILEIHAESQTVLDKDSGKMILRRVGWQPVEPLAAARLDSAAETTDSGFSTIFPQDRVHSMISVRATVYDETFTELIWRDPSLAGANPISIWVNRDFRYFSSIHRFELNNVHYSYIGFTGSVDTDAYVTHPVTGEKFLLYKLPEWMPSAEDFPSDEAAYIVRISEENEDVPELLYQQMDALLAHFVENEAELIAAYQRSEMLRKAREQLDELEPEKKKDIVINYWPIQSNADR